MMITKCHPSSQFLPFARKSSKHLLFFSLLLWALLITPGWVHAQRDAPPCGITTEYLVIDLTTTDKYITDGTVTGSGHLPSVPGNSTAYTIYIKGSHKLIFNASYHFAPGTQIIFDDYSDDSGIYGGFIVQAGKVLTLQSSSAYPTTVRGCGDMWESITVNSTGKLIIQPQCTIRDAYRAVTLESNAILTADEAIFKANYTCIRVQPVSPYIYAPVNTYLTGNTFSGADALIRSGGLLVGGVYFNYPHYGIDAFNAKNLNIDADGSPSYPNVFKDYGLSKYEGPTAGIRGIASIITVKNAKFSNIGVLDSQAGGTAGYGILMTNTNGHVTSVLTVKGRGKTSSPSTFDHVYYGIETENVNLNIRNSRFTNGNIHINLPAGTTLSLLNCDIIGNSFEDYQTYGIHAVGMLPTAHFNVNLNDFTLTSDDLDQDGYIAGGLFSAYGTPATGLRLVSNNFRNNITVASGFDPGTSYGFNISGGQSASVVSNNFTNNEGHAIGVHMMGTLLNTDNRNMYVGISSNDIGFEAIDAMKTSISCDTFNNLGTGAFFQGLANDGSAVVENHFGSHAIGLHLADLTQIGLQRFRRNTWLPATTGQEDAEFNADPLSSIYGALLLNSRFIIHQATDLGGSIYWANPRIPTGNAWFTGISSILPTSVCGTGPAPGPGNGGEGLTHADSTVIAGTHPAYADFDATRWDAQLRLYRLLYEKPSLRPTSSSPATFYTTNASTPYALMGTALAKYDKLMKPDSTLKVRVDQLYGWFNSAQDTINKVDSLFIVSPTRPDSTTLRTKRTTATTVRDSVNTLLADVVFSFDTMRVNHLYTLQTGVAAISVTTAYEANLKTVLGILLTASRSDSLWHWTTVQKSKLDSIAGLCRLSGGYGVLLARLMTGSKAGIEDGCTINYRSGLPSDIKILQEWTVQPNPTTGILQISLPAILPTGTLELYDQQGRMVAKRRIEAESNFFWNLQAVSNGLYYLRLTGGSENFPVQKILLQH